MDYNVVLNDDCLLLIFKLLGLKDQISVALACQRFHNLVSYLWQKTYLKLSLNFGIEDITETEFNVLLKGISETVQQMRLRDLNFERLEVLKLYTYPNLAKLSFTQWSQTPLGDDSVLIMTEIFPKLQSFSPHGPYSGKYIENWQSLQYLNLTYCAKVKFSNMEKIFEKLVLKSVQLNIFERHYEWTSDHAFRNFCKLQDIFLNSTELAWLSNLSKFINLKELTVADRDSKGPLREFLKSLNENKSNDLLDVETDLNFPFYETQPREFMHLKRLVLLSKDISHYISVPSYAANLREIIFKCCEISLPTDLTFFLSQSTLVEFISIEQSRWAFRDFTINVSDITQYRTRQLHLNFYENFFIDVDDPNSTAQSISVKVMVKGTSPLFKVTYNICSSVSFQPLRIRFL